MEKYTYSNGGTVKAGNGQFYAEAYSKEKARRIAVCLTVLDCVPIDELEKAGTGMMSDAAVKVGELTKQRDELLSVLKGLVLDENVSVCSSAIEGNGTDLRAWGYKAVELIKRIEG